MVFKEIITICFLHASVVNLLIVSKKYVAIEQGVLEGSTQKTNSGFHYDVFYNIPYAAPPIGRLRFKAPDLPYSWYGVRNATTPGESCFQMLNTDDRQYVGVEDCLQLNVFVPSQISKPRRLPVMFYIHGGGFDKGSGSPYDAKFLVEKDVIVVTGNYRLGILGFLALGTAEVPGNPGLKDILMMLKWIRRNIKYFGGDPGNVTIFGNSAGSASVHFLIMSPSANGLFKRAIIQSGVSTNEWPIQLNSQNITKSLMDIVGIHGNNIYELINVLQNVPVELVALIAKQFPYTYKRITVFRPVIENKLSLSPVIREDPNKLMKSGKFNRVPTLNGFTSQEGILFLYLTNINENSTVDNVVSNFNDYIPRVIRNSLTPEQTKLVEEKIKNFYFPDNRNITERFVNLNTDHQFVKDLQKSAQIFSKYNSHTYYYMFSYNGVWNMNKYPHKYDYEGASHGDENGYLFDLSQMLPSGLVPSQQDHLIRRRIVELWTNFAKYGNPTPYLSEDVDVIWEPVTKDKMNCLIIDRNLSLVQDPLHDRVEFWRQLENGKLFNK